MEIEGGNRERMRKCRESISLHVLIFSPFPPHFLILSPFPRSPAARLQRFVQPWPLDTCVSKNMFVRGSHWTILSNWLDAGNFHDQRPNVHYDQSRQLRWHKIDVVTLSGRLATVLENSRKILHSTYEDFGNNQNKNFSVICNFI